MFSKFKEIKDRVLKGYTRYDLYDLDYWFQTIFVNMLSDFEKSLFSSPGNLSLDDIRNYDVKWINDNYKNIVMTIKENSYYNTKHKTIEEIEEDYFEDGIYEPYIIWRLVLRRIIYCFKESSEDQCSMKNEYWDKYWDLVFETEYTDEELNKVLSDPETMKLNESVQKRNQEIDDYRNKMKDEAFELLSKWFFALWN